MIVIFGVVGCVWGLCYSKKLFATSPVSESIGATLTSNRHWNEILFYFPLTLPSLAAGPQGVAPCLYLRGILAAESQDRALALVNRLAAGKLQLIEDADAAADEPNAADPPRRTGGVRGRPRRLTRRVRSGLRSPAARRRGRFHPAEAANSAT